MFVKNEKLLLSFFFRHNHENGQSNCHHCKLHHVQCYSEKPDRSAAVAKGPGLSIQSILSNFPQTLDGT